MFDTMFMHMQICCTYVFQTVALVSIQFAYLISATTYVAQA